MLIKICALQLETGGGIPLRDRLQLLRRRPDFVCLPEYFFVSNGDADHHASAGAADRHRETIARLSRDLSCTVIGGSIVVPADNGLANTCLVYDHGEPKARYEKVNLYGREPEQGLRPGSSYCTFAVGGVRVGILICADVLNPDSFAAMRRLGAEVVFCPTVSQYKESDTVDDKNRRDRDIFVLGAQRARGYVVKTSGVGTLFGKRLQGRSGVFAPWGILQRVPPAEEHRRRILTEILDIGEIREFKARFDASALAAVDRTYVEDANGPEIAVAAELREAVVSQGN